MQNEQTVQIQEVAGRAPALLAQLLGYGFEQYGVNELAVNEQNPQARGFYEHMGFHVYQRDEQGGPYPILHMRRGEAAL